MIDPRLVEIQQTLIDVLTEHMARKYLVLPLSDDGQRLTLFCPSDIDSAYYRRRVSREFNREIDCIPVARDILLEAIDQCFASIDNCVFEFHFKCPKTWNSLNRTNNDRIRHCSTCQSEVYWCDSRFEAKSLAKEGKCIALKEIGGVALGMFC